VIAIALTGHGVQGKVRNQKPNTPKKQKGDGMKTQLITALAVSLVGLQASAQSLSKGQGDLRVNDLQRQ
jgi:hypothetical protein